MRRPLLAAMTFIGPITTEKAGARPWPSQFLILQPGSGVIKLEYPDRATAKAARDQLLQSPHTHKVPSNKLLMAILQALAEHSGETYGPMEAPAPAA